MTKSSKILPSSEETLLGDESEQNQHTDLSNNEFIESKPPDTKAFMEGVENLEARIDQLLIKAKSQANLNKRRQSKILTPNQKLVKEVDNSSCFYVRFDSLFKVSSLIIFIISSSDYFNEP